MKVSCSRCSCLCSLATCLRGVDNVTRGNKDSHKYGTKLLKGRTAGLLGRQERNKVMSISRKSDELSHHGSETSKLAIREDAKSSDELASKQPSLQGDDCPSGVLNEIVPQDEEKKSSEGDEGGAGDRGAEGEKRESFENAEEASNKHSSGKESPLKSASGSMISKATDIKIETESDSEKSMEEENAITEGSHQSIRVVTQDASPDESVSSGFQVATNILERLLDEVVRITNKEDETFLDSKKGSEAEDLEPKISSITTIKSEDEQGSIEVDEELEAQLALEREATALKQQQIYQENISEYHSLVASRAHLKRKNAFLMRQMYEHYKRKKIEHLFKEMPIANTDMEGRYIKILLAYEEARKAAEEEEAKMTRLIETQEEKTKAVESDLEQEYTNLLNREREVAKGLISAQTVKPLSDKTIEGLIQRQISKAKEVAAQRYAFFKLRDIAGADESQLKSLENLGENLTLIEYEQLKMQSQSCVEKLEERDADLHRLRRKATTAIQVLAEVREKTHTLQEDIESGKVVLHDVHNQLVQTRERLGCEKRRRDMSRSDTVRLRQEAGLLSEPKLMQDFKESLAEKENLLQQLEDWKQKFELQKQTILRLRKALATSQQRVTRTEP